MQNAREGQNVSETQQQVLNVPGKTFAWRNNYNSMRRLSWLLNCHLYVNSIYNTPMLALWMRVRRSWKFWCLHSFYAGSVKRTRPKVQLGFMSIDLFLQFDRGVFDVKVQFNLMFLVVD